MTLRRCLQLLIVSMVLCGGCLPVGLPLAVGLPRDDFPAGSSGPPTAPQASPPPTNAPAPAPEQAGIPTPAASASPEPTGTPTPAPSPTAPPKPSPSPVAVATPAPAGDPVIAAIEAEVFSRTNAFRQENGLGPFSADARLAAFARSRSEDMASRNYFSHTTPDGKGVFDLMEEAGIPYRAARENIAKNKGYAADKVAGVAVDGWIKSAGHRANMLATNVAKLGVGVAKAPDGTYYLTQVFTN